MYLARMCLLCIYISNIIKYTYMDTSLSFIKVTHVQCYLAYIYIYLRLISRVTRTLCYALLCAILFV